MKKKSWCVLKMNHFINSNTCVNTLGFSVHWVRFSHEDGLWILSKLHYIFFICLFFVFLESWGICFLSLSFPAGITALHQEKSPKLFWQRIGMCVSVCVLMCVCVIQYIFMQRSVNSIQTPYWLEAVFPITTVPLDGCAEDWAGGVGGNKESHWAGLFPSDRVGGSWGCSLKRGQQRALCCPRVRHVSDEGQTGSLTAHRPALEESFLIATALLSPLCLEVVAPPSPLVL